MNEPRVLIPAEEIARRRGEIAATITRDYAGEEIVLVCVLKGSMVFFVDLAREIPLRVRFDYLAVSSYDDATRSSGAPRLRADLSGPVEDRHVIVVEDIVDTGLTLRAVLDLLRARRPRSLRVAALLDKPSRRHPDVAIEVDYLGFTIPDRFVVGYGLDWSQLYRNLPYIGVLEPPPG